MSQRPHATKWLWCLLTLYAGPARSPVDSVSVQNPPKNPSVIEAQAKFFQDFFSVQLSPYKIEFGHVCEDPNTWEQRYEKKDFKNHRDMGKVRWGDKQGGYGEHYWDLNHAGHGNNDHGNDEYDGSSDDGSYNHDLDHAHDDNNGHDSHDAYDEPSEQSPTYGSEEYDPEKAARYDEIARAKRAQPRIKTERKLVREEEMYEEEPQFKPQKQNRKIRERLQAAPTQQVEKVTEKPDNDTDQQPPKRKRYQRRPQLHPQPQENENESQQEKNEDNQPKDAVNQNEPEKPAVQQYYTKRQPENQFVPYEQGSGVRQHQNEPEKPAVQQYYTKRQPENQFVPYEQGSGVRQHHQPGVTAASSMPRLFLEPTTGHVVDRATGQAYVLQPIAGNNYY